MLSAGIVRRAGWKKASRFTSPVKARRFRAIKDAAPSQKKSWRKGSNARDRSRKCARCMLPRIRLYLSSFEMAVKRASGRNWPEASLFLKQKNSPQRDTETALRTTELFSVNFCVSVVKKRLGGA